MKLRYILLPVLCILLMSHNASAIDLTQNVVYQGSGSSPQWRDDSNSSASNTWHTGRSIYGGNSGNASSFQSFYIRGESGSNLPIQNSWYLQVQGRVYFSGSNGKWNTSGNFIYTSTGNCPIVDMDVIEVQNHAGSTNATDQIFNYSIICKYTGSNNGVPQIGFKVQSSSQLDVFHFSVLNWFLWQYRSNAYDDTDVINAINNVRSSINNIYNSLGDTNQKLDDMLDALDTLNESQTQQQQQEQEATDNISNQSPSDMGSDVENQQTTSIINLFGSFLSALTSVNAGSCVIQLPFPSYAGGNWTMNICQYKDKAGNIISLFGSATLILFYLPVAWRLLGMIYNEIRSFTNG